MVIKGVIMDIPNLFTCEKARVMELWLQPFIGNFFSEEGTETLRQYSNLEPGVAEGENPNRPCRGSRARWWKTLG